MAATIILEGRNAPELLTPGEVAQVFRVDPKTVSRWARAGKLPEAARTPEGHRRFRTSDVVTLFREARVVPVQAVKAA